MEMRHSAARVAVQMDLCRLELAVKAAAAASEQMAILGWVT